MGHSPYSVQPSTLDGIKRRAKDIRKQNQISHFDALELAAQQAGFQNFQHARHVIEQNVLPLPLNRSYPVYLSAYWRDTSTKPSKAGLEIIRIELPQPLLAFLQKNQIGRTRNLHGFFLESDDHLEMRSDNESQTWAREQLYKAALTLQFIEATGLRPVTNQRQRNAMEHMHALPNNDHDSEWVNSSGDWIYLDEPYEHAKKQPELDRREA
ncbi:MULTISPECIES: hypothetical protein [unclassified Pseudomonas]|uniref:hypothetical protein n=1 Tax=unclassified Pseudomonas TaxID=196821 RepID=UPI0002A247D1|nr:MULTISPECIES: hypothetical protein [unclassified Pseudomonas]NTX92257.1 hypothetical protein [Pseudomonas sp. UMA643]NTY19961.1 hypothetical protein [Pseudomonas sp. UMC3103]NTY27667.1 hypothetical protein [Pseudomonas sp. UMA603]NTY33245.1 hypothetical protein [Pseudomonas sp. UMC3129]NTY56793.1 hypothetical protein [Pseudomonas sp. UMC631]